MRFFPDKFGNESIKRTSAILNNQFDTLKPTWLETAIQFNELQDETEFLQYGQEDKVEYLTFEKKSLHASSWVDHPSVNATGLYKFVSVELNLDQQRLVIMRETYDILSWLGDVGGLTDCLLLIGKFILKPFTSYSLQTFLLSGLFRMQPLNTHNEYQQTMTSMRESNNNSKSQRKEVFL